MFVFIAFPVFLAARSRSLGVRSCACVWECVFLELLQFFATPPRWVSTFFHAAFPGTAGKFMGSKTNEQECCLRFRMTCLLVALISILVIYIFLFIFWEPNAWPFLETDIFAIIIYILCFEFYAANRFAKCLERQINKTTISGVWYLQLSKAEMKFSLQFVSSVFWLPLKGISSWR